MRIETMTRELYKFSELSKEAQNKAINLDRELLISDDQCLDVCLEWIDYRLAQLGFKDHKSYYSGFGSQGDGFCFEFKGLDLEKLIKGVADEFPEVLEKGDLETLKKALRLNDLIYVSTFETPYSRYCHENSRGISVEFSLYLGYRFKCIPHFLNELEETLKGIYERLCRGFYRELESEYQYLQSDKAIRLYLEDHDFEFLEDGTYA